MASKDVPSTAALRALKAAKVPFTTHTFEYEEKGGTRHSAEVLGVPEHSVIKTLILEDQDGQPLVVLMHGDMQVSTKNLARFLGVKLVQPCDPAVAQKHSGYVVGGTSPFGLKKKMTIYAESSIQELDSLYINGGGRGLLVGITPKVLQDLLKPTWVQVGNPK